MRKSAQAKIEKSETGKSPDRLGYRFFPLSIKVLATSLGFAWVLNTAKTCDFPRGLTLGGALNLQEKLHIL